MTFVSDVIFLHTEAGSKLRVSGSTSAKTTLAPRVAAAFAVEIQLSGVVMTSSPGPTRAAIIARCKPVVQEVTASACFVPQYCANSCSNLLTHGPQDGALASRTAIRASRSSGPYA